LKVEEDEEVEEDTEICIFLFSDKKEIYEIYGTARLYLDENLSLSPALVLRLLDKRNIDIETGLKDVFYIHSGYVSVILQDMKNGREHSED
jgi:hypothetical protein